MKEKGDGRLTTWIERRFDELNWSITFTPPNCPAFQPIELFWAAGKNWVARNFRVGRAFDHVKDLLVAAWDHQPDGKHTATGGCDVPGMISHAHDAMDHFIFNGAVLSGSVHDLGCSDDNRDFFLEHDPKFMTPEELAHVMGDDEAEIEIPVPAGALTAPE